VRVDRLPKGTHLILVKTNYNGPKLVELYVEKIECLPEVPKKKVSDQGTQFMPHFWQ